MSPSSSILRASLWARAAAALLAFALSVGAAAAETLAYEVSFDGAPQEMRESLEKLTVVAGGARRPPTRAALRAAGRSDAGKIEQALQAAGYYTARARFELAISDTPDDETMIAAFKIEPGPKHRIVDHVIVYLDTAADGAPLRPDSPAVVGLELTENADGATLRANQQTILSALWNAGYPAARAVARRAEAAGAPGEARAIYEFETGPLARFGEIEADGLERTKPSFITKLKTWEEGDLFEREKLVTYRERLLGAGIFDAVEVDNGPPDADGAAPVLVTASERKRRTIGVGASFSTVEGPGGRFFFEYRNLFGAGESARAEIEASEIQQSITFELDKPLPAMPGAAFAAFEFANETTNAFDARTVIVSAGLSKRWLDDRLETRGALAFETSSVESETGEERTAFVSAPLSVTWNTEDDPLALDNGERASLVVTPYAGTDTFTRAEFNARSRTHFGPDDRFTLAGRARLGATVGTSLNDLPANRRFFSGGGSSVRGFEFQAVGPLDDDDDPIGGRSVIEGGVEVRAMTIANVQVAAFADAGSVSASALPDFSGDFLVGVGGGARYLSPIGPLRVDIAIPVDRRPSDRAWQAYISLGQPF